MLLSLVRTRRIGHMRDIRRLIVALSRARLGLYVFGREALFRSSVELSPCFQHLLKFPTKLALVPTEAFPGARQKEEKRIPYLVEDPVAMGHVVNQLVLQSVEQSPLFKIDVFNETTEKSKLVVMFFDRDFHLSNSAQCAWPSSLLILT